MKWCEMVLATVGAAISSSAMQGATLCASASGDAGCYTTISAAVAAAASGDTVQVYPGTYFEQVSFTKALSLVGNSATIDASGQFNGILVVGPTSRSLAGLHISGFTVKNALLEGILVWNATDVTISSNYVTGNDRAVTPTGCLEGSHASEEIDCGGGIHLISTDHSVVNSNVVQGNGGGIQLSDDTGASFSNLVSLNTTSDNANASGILLVSLPLPAGPTPYVAYGVYHNTVYGNRSQRNGQGSGYINGGAGVSIVASSSGKNYSNVIVDNLLTENRGPGVEVYATDPGAQVSDNVILGNVVVSNGSITPTPIMPGSTGISVYTGAAQTGNMITSNSIEGESFDVLVNDPALVLMSFNALQMFGGGAGVGLVNTGTGPVDATENWWSCPNGPGIPWTCASATGPNIQGYPGLSAPVTTQANF